ncbi:MAG TPA: amidase [Ktedonobacteraceae bacterium]|nr:amidase [Ktedonobacteraceae bacterium]
MNLLLLSLPLTRTAQALRTEQIDLLAFIERICDHIDALEPQIHALLPEPGRRERLLAEARALQKRFPDPASRPALYGILVGVKDVFNADGFPTRAGSQLPPSLFAGTEAACVSALRAAGAIMLGKTVSTEFAWVEPGPTRNPHNAAHTPGGSSSGSAAAVAAGFCPLALGTQTVGSVIRPAAFCGIVGYKASYGRISTDGLVFFSPSLDTIGYFTQDVAGAALVASLLCKDWSPTDIKRLPILGVPDGPYLAQASPEGLVAFEGHVSALEKAGYTIRRVKAMSDIAAINQRNRQLMFAEMARVHATWFSQYESLYRPRTTAAIREGQAVDNETLTVAQMGRFLVRAKFQVLMSQNGIDLWLAPAATGPAPEGIISTGDPLMNLPWTHAGLPVITLPAGKAANGLPLGLQCVADFMADEKLVVWAEDIAKKLR